MDEWHKVIQQKIDVIDLCIKSKRSEDTTLTVLSQKFGYSEFYISRKFREFSGMKLKDYLRYRRLAFAFKEAYSITPNEYRRNSIPVILRTHINPLDCYLLGIGGPGMAATNEDVKVYFVTIPVHKFLHIRNYENIENWDCWQKQASIPGQDCATICRLLNSIPDKLDDMGRAEADSGSGQIMAFINEPTGCICSWGLPLA